MQIDGDDLLSHEVQRHLANNNNTEIERGLVLPRPSHGLVRAGMPPSRRKEKVGKRNPAQEAERVENALS